MPIIGGEKRYCLFTMPGRHYGESANTELQPRPQVVFQVRVQYREEQHRCSLSVRYKRGHGLEARSCLLMPLDVDPEDETVEEVTE
jgi:hypothetical protein